MYVDNCTSHSNPEIVEIHSIKLNIHERSLIPLATHLQQPMDQHIGKNLQEFCQNEYWNYCENILDEIDEGKRNEGAKKVGIKVKRQCIIKWANEAFKKVNTYGKLCV